MTGEMWTIIGTGIALAALNIGLVAWLRGDMNLVRIDLAKLSARVDALSERMARMEGKMDLLLQGLQIRIEPRPPA